MKIKHTEQVIFDAYKMIEQEFYDYYQGFWQTTKKEIDPHYEKIKSKIKSGDYEVVCYKDDHYFMKSTINKKK